MKSILLISLIVLPFFISGCQFDPSNAIQASSNIYKAATLSDAEVQKLGKESSVALDKENTVAKSSSSYAKRLARLSNRFKNEDGLNLNFKVYVTKDINAFALPDGSVRVYTGIMDLMSDDELTFIIGHEIGHVKLGHSKARLRMAYGITAARYGIASVSSSLASLSQSQVTDLASEFINSHYSQINEYEADECGVQLLKKLGKNKNIAVSSLSKLGSGGGGYLSTHPATEDRIRKIQSMQ